MSQMNRLINLGITKNSTKINWLFDCKHMANRHMLLQGLSGSGKTYLMQKILFNSSEQGIPSIIIDNSGSFTKKEIECKKMNIPWKNIDIITVYNDGLPVNPFIAHSIVINDELLQEKPVTTANRISTLFANVFKLSSPQSSLIFEWIKDSLESNSHIELSYDNLLNWAKIKAKNLNIVNALKRRLITIFETVNFLYEAKFNWTEKLYDSNKILIFNLEGYQYDLKLLISSLILCDLWNFTIQYGNKDKPFILALDEFQNYNFDIGSIYYKMLTEGRKYGYATLLATQSSKPLYKNISVIEQAATKIFFKPASNDENIIAKSMSNSSTLKDMTEVLRNLKIGECVYDGLITSDGERYYKKPIKFKVT